MRRDALHKASTEIRNNHAMIILENLGTSRMSKSAKGYIGINSGGTIPTDEELDKVKKMIQENVNNGDKKNKMNNRI